MFVENHLDATGELIVVPHEGFSEVSTALPKKDKNRPYVFTYSDYDHLVDCPLEIGNQLIFDFDASGVKHTVAIYGEGNFEIERLKMDMTKVIEEETKKWFDLPVDKSPHMLFNSFVVKDKRKQIPSVVHVDGSARVQTVSKRDNKKIYMLLQEFFKETGVPVLLNTSFNLGGEPIVESPADAVRTFPNSNIDVLVMQNYYCKKKA